MRLAKRLLFIAFSLIAALWLINTNAFVTLPTDQEPHLIAHRGVHQIYVGDSRVADTCTADPIAPLDHAFIANTRASMQAAFAAGADVVEIDVHLTMDDQFAVFHDWTLGCQTDGVGITHQQDMAYLKQLDIGFGYTSDGETYPLRGSAVGQMPTLAEILTADLDGTFLVNFKSDRRREGEVLASRFNEGIDPLWGVYGGANPTRAVIAATSLRGFDRDTLKTCLMRYVLTGWTGQVPAVCADMIVAVPMDYGPYLWGWPHKFTRRMKAVGTDVILWGPYDGSGFSSGVDDAETLARVPEQFDGYIWTNKIEVIGPLLGR